IRVRMQSLPSWVTDIDTIAGAAIRYADAPGESAQVVVRDVAEHAAFHVSYDDGIQFVVDHAGTRIWLRWPQAESLEAASMYLLGPILAFALRLRGTMCLHASVIELEQKAVVLVGGEGAGKSTLAATLARRG